MTNSKQIDHTERRKALAEAAAEVKKTDAIAQLAYFKYVRDMLENDGTTDATRKSYDEMMNFYNDRIEDLEMDAVGKPRYDYVLGVKEDNGDTDWTQYPPYTKTFKTSQQVSAHVAQTVSNWMERRNWMERGGDEGDNDDDLNEPFPTAESIDARLGDAEYSSEIQLFAYGDPYVSCLSFTLSRNRLN